MTRKLYRDKRSKKANGGMTMPEFIATFLHLNPGSSWKEIKTAIYTWRKGVPPTKASHLQIGNVFLQVTAYPTVDTNYVDRLWYRVSQGGKPKWFLTLEGLNYVRNEYTTYWKDIDNE